uniref:Uncharacterized protein n=1 Tax=Anguilla anguilla TaxID=7936 RepID=A0A0E9UDA1_ANGAN
MKPALKVLFDFMPTIIFLFSPCCEALLATWMKICGINYVYSILLQMKERNFSK